MNFRAAALPMLCAAMFSACAGESGNQDGSEGPSQKEVSAVYNDCFVEGLNNERYESDSQDRVFSDCLDENLGMTEAEAIDIMRPVSGLPLCDDIWTEGVVWDSMDDFYGQECRYGSGDGKRYVAEVDYCFRGFEDNVEKAPILIIGPDGLYVFRGGIDGYESPIEDGTEFSTAAGESVVDIARRNC